MLALSTKVNVLIPSRMRTIVNTRPAVLWSRPEMISPKPTPDRKTGIGRWRANELAEYLETGMTPDGDSAGDLMAEVIDNGLKYLRKEDLAAIAEYVLSLPPVEHSVRKAKKPVKKEEFE